MSLSAAGDLPALAITIREAHQAATTADTIANVAIKVSLKKRLLAGEALTAARALVDPDKWLPWLAQLGITMRDAKRHMNFPAQAKIEARYKRYGSNNGYRSPPDPLPTSLTAARATIAKMARDVDQVPFDELARIERVAEAVKFLFWDAPDVREAALDVVLRAGARLR
jgi:hypothetical protein